MGDQAMQGISGSPTGMREPQSAPFCTAASGHGASGSHFPAHHHGDFSSTRNPECPVCREMVDTLTNCLTSDSDGGASFFLGMILTYVFG